MPTVSIRAAICAVLFSLAVSCGGSTAVDDLNSRVVTLPGGQKVKAEVMIHPGDMGRGMMFRDSLAPDRGMLFLHRQSGRHTYWMYQVKIPLDIIWLDENRRIVEISANTPPCEKGANECPHYGGKADSRYVLELAGGMARKFGLQEGHQLKF
jgi:uncharacterized protein